MREIISDSMRDGQDCKAGSQTNWATSSRDGQVPNLAKVILNQNQMGNSLSTRFEWSEVANGKAPLTKDGNYWIEKRLTRIIIRSSSIIHFSRKPRYFIRCRKYD